MVRKHVAIALVVLTTLLTSVAQLFFKEGSARLPVIISNWPLVIGFVLYGLGAVLLVYALKGGEVSTLYPITASSHIWVTLLAWYLFNEQIHPLKILGLSFVIAGIISLGFAAKHPSSVDYTEPA